MPSPPCPSNPGQADKGRGNSSLNRNSTALSVSPPPKADGTSRLRDGERLGDVPGMLASGKASPFHKLFPQSFKLSFCFGVHPNTTLGWKAGQVVVNVINPEPGSSVEFGHRFTKPCFFMRIIFPVSIGRRFYDIVEIQTSKQTVDTIHFPRRKPHEVKVRAHPP